MSRLILCCTLFFLFIQCEDGIIENDTPLLALNKEITDANNNTYTAYNIISENGDINCALCKRNEDGDTLWNYLYDETSLHCTSEMLALALDEQWLYAVFNINGNSFEKEYITRLNSDEGAFMGTLFESYGFRTVNDTVSILAQIDKTEGVIERGTFLLARSRDGNISDEQGITRSFRLVSLGVDESSIKFVAVADSFPPGIMSTTNRFSRFDGEANGTENRNWRLFYEIDTTLLDFLTVELL